MTKGFLKGLIKPTVNIEMDMSEKTQNTYYTLKIGAVVIANEQIAEQIAKIIASKDITFTETEETEETEENKEN